MPRSRTIGAIGACLALAGCGADGPPPRTPPQPAPPPEAQSVGRLGAEHVQWVDPRIERAFDEAAGYCAAKQAGGSVTSPASRIRRDVYDLVTLERTNPRTRMSFSQASLGTAFNDLAASLRPCEPVLAAELELLAAALPEA